MEWKDGIQIGSIKQLKKELFLLSWEICTFFLRHATKAVIHPWNTICISQGWQTAGADPTTRFLLSAAQEWIRCVYSRAIDSLILHASPPERVGGIC